MNSFRFCIQGIVINLSAVVILFDLAAGSVLVMQFFLITCDNDELNNHCKMDKSVMIHLPVKQARNRQKLNKS